MGESGMRKNMMMESFNRNISVGEKYAPVRVEVWVAISKLPTYNIMRGEVIDNGLTMLTIPSIAYQAALRVVYS